MAFLKPQSPLIKGNDYFYPLTTADQIIMNGGYRLDQIVGKTKKSTITLYQNGWSAAAPYSYSIVVNGLTDDLNMQVFPHYPENFAEKQALKEEFTKVSFCSRQDNIVTFECWDEIPSVDIDIDIEVNVMYPIEVALEEDIKARLPKLNYSIVGGTTQPDNPSINTIWINTDETITGWVFNHNRPLHPYQGLVWIATRESSMVSLNTLKINDIETDLIYVLSAEQYINGVWQAKYTKIYYDSQWNECWNGGLYDNGYEWETITGGWKIISVDSHTISPNMAKEPTFLYGNIAPNTGGAIITTKKVDMTDYNRLYISTLSVTEGFNCGVYGDFSSAALPYESSVAAKYFSASTNPTTYFIDVSTLYGSYYVAFADYGSKTYQAKIDKVWLEK